MSSELVDSPASIARLINTITNQPQSSTPTLYMDLEGINLSRHGSISILTLLIHPLDIVYLIDIHTLNGSAFSTPGPCGQTLRDILCDPNIPKVLFDLRNDSNALYFHFDIALQAISDLQLMELASRRGSLARKRLVHGLGRCIDRDAPLSEAQKQIFSEIKEKGVNLFAPEKGGRYEVFNERPLRKEIVDYCEQDVRFLPVLFDVYQARLATKHEWRSKVEVETRKRLRESQMYGYEAHGRDKVLGPWQVEGETPGDGRAQWQV